MYQAGKQVQEKEGIRAAGLRVPSPVPRAQPRPAPTLGPRREALSRDRTRPGRTQPQRPRPRRKQTPAPPRPRGSNEPAQGCAGPAGEPRPPPLTEVIQREAALVRGPRLEALGPEVHGRRHDGGARSLQERRVLYAGRPAERRAGPRRSADHVERRAAPPGRLAPPLAL